MSFYNLEPSKWFAERENALRAKPLSFGAKTWMRRCNVRSKLGEPEIAYRPTLAIGFPFLELEPIYGAQMWPDSQIMYWSFQQARNIPLHCIFDLLHRLEFHKYWGDDYLQVPVDWRLGNAKCKAYAAKKLAEINKGEFKEIRPFYRPGGRDFTKWRHQFTPYDYEWQTKKYSRDKAYNHWGKIFKENA